MTKTDSGMNNARLNCRQSQGNKNSNKPELKKSWHAHTWHPNERLFEKEDNAKNPGAKYSFHVHNGIIMTDKKQHQGRYMYPDESFLQSLQQLGFDRNDGVVILMPLCVIYDDDNSA